MNKSLLAWSFIAGAVATPVLVWAWLLVSAYQSAAAISAAGGLPITIVSNPFLDLHTTSGGTVSLAGGWLWGIIALIGGVAFVLAVGGMRLILTAARRSYRKAE